MSMIHHSFLMLVNRQSLGKNFDLFAATTNVKVRHAQGQRSANMQILPAHTHFCCRSPALVKKVVTRARL